MFYRKYRPQNFKDLYGLEPQAKALQMALSKDPIPHALLFFGPRGVGKTSTARIVAKYINCLTPLRELEPCGQCENCSSFRKDSFIDLLEMDAASNRGIDDVRQLKERAILAPSKGKYKIYIIDEVHMMTREAFNALLKLLEEPPAHCLFILCTTEKEKIPSTIVSRCQPFTFKRAKISDIIRKLENIAKTESAEISKEDLRKIAQESDGGFRDAENMLEQVIRGGSSIDDLFGKLSDKSIYEFINYLATKDAKEAIILLNNLFNSGVDLEIFTRELLKNLRLLVYFKLHLDKELFEGLQETASEINELQQKFSASDLQLALTLFNNPVGKINKHPFPPMLLEMAVLDYCLRNSGKLANVSDSNNNDGGGSVGGGGVRQFTEPSLTMKEPVIIEKDFHWETFLSFVKPHNHSVEALLRSCRLIKLDNSGLYIEVFYQFHKERLESAQCKNILKDVLINNFGISCMIVFSLSMERLNSDANQEPEVTSKIELRDSLPQADECLIEAAVSDTTIDTNTAASDVFTGQL